MLKFKILLKLNIYVIQYVYLNTYETMPFITYKYRKSEKIYALEK